MKKLFSVLLLSMAVLTLQAKSIIFTLTDGTKVYYLLGSDQSPKMKINTDGTFTMNSDEYSFANIQSFRISDTDYSGEEGTKEGASDIIAIGNGTARMKGEVGVYTLDGRLVAKGTDGADLQSLPADTYVISNGRQTLKIQKQ